MERKHFFRLAALVFAFSLSITASSQASFFSTDFETGSAPPEFSGVVSVEGTQGYNGYGFGTYFLRNSSTGNPASATTLTLTGLPAHTGIEVKFFLAIIDSWDGTITSVAPDFFNVKIDGTTIFSETFDHSTDADQSYVPPPGVRLADRAGLGFSGWPDSAYDMGKDPFFLNIAHNASTLTIQWFASGGGWQGGGDESWAIDNVEINLHAVPLPGSLLLLAGGLVPILGLRRARARKE